MDIVTSALTSLQWLIAPASIGTIVASTVVLLTGIPGRMVLWIESELSSKRNASSARMGR